MPDEPDEQADEFLRTCIQHTNEVAAVLNEMTEVPPTAALARLLMVQSLHSHMAAQRLLARLETLEPPPAVQP